VQIFTCAIEEGTQPVVQVRSLFDLRWVIKYDWRESLRYTRICSFCHIRSVAGAWAATIPIRILNCRLNPLLSLTHMRWKGSEKEACSRTLAISDAESVCRRCLRTKSLKALAAMARQSAPSSVRNCTIDDIATAMGDTISPARRLKRKQSNVHLSSSSTVKGPAQSSRQD
jgi:hypothetical protein